MFLKTHEGIMEIKTIELNKIVSKFNTRTKESEMDVADLMASIKKQGLLQPIGVVKNGDKYSVVFGNRRLQAFKKLGLKEIPAVVVVGKDIKQIELNLVENLQREDLTVYEYGNAIFNMMNKYMLSTAEVAVNLGISEGSVRDYLSVYTNCPSRYRDKIFNLNWKGRKPNNYIPLSSAIFLSALQKENKISKSKIEQLWSHTYERKVRVDELRKIAPKLKAGHSLKESLDFKEKEKSIPINLIFSENIYKEISTVYTIKGFTQKVIEYANSEAKKLLGK